jgi:prefoldin subunit 5
MRRAHEALIKYANAPRTPENMSQLVSTLQALDSHAQLVQKEVEQIRQATKG